MSNYALRIPDSLFEYARKCAEDESVSMNQFFVMAIAEKVSALKTAEYFAARAKIASPRRAADILRKVADRSPEADDEIMPALAARQTRATYAVKGAVAVKRTASSRKRTRR
jgi:hypothetical protein